MDQQLPVSQPNAEPMSVKDWIITLLITYIPLVGLIMLLVWAFDSSTHPNKKNFAKASLIWMLIWIVLALIFFALFASMMMGVMGNME
jgi:heme/copper-type cytochrome/quinol oxidase subunit 2